MSTKKKKLLLVSPRLETSNPIILITINGTNTATGRITVTSNISRSASRTENNVLEASDFILLIVNQTRHFTKCSEYEDFAERLNSLGAHIEIFQDL